MQKFVTMATAVTLVSLFPADPVQAQQPSDSDNPDHLAALKACQAIAESNARLTCYDSAVSGMVAAADQGDLQIVDREDVKKTRRRLFGFSLPNLGIFGSGDDRKEEDRELEILESTITGVRYSRSDAFTFSIEEGDAVWQVTNAPSRLRKVKPGDNVVFKKAALGSYFIRINGQTGVKGRRVR